MAQRAHRTPAIIHNMATRERQKSIEPPSFGEQDPGFLEVCASVRYLARFADEEPVVYLAGCKVREKLTVPECDEVEKLQGAPAVSGSVQAEVVTGPKSYSFQVLGTAWTVIPNPPALTGINTWSLSPLIESGIRLFHLRLP